MDMEKHSSVRNILIMLFMAALLVGSFIYLSNRERQTQDENVKVSAVDEVLLVNLDTDYPVTPKEVVKMYSEITRCFYGEEYTQDQLLKLAEQSRKLFDDELRANQTDEQYIANLNTVIQTYKEENRMISSYSVGSSANVEYYDYENADWAKLNCIYTVRTGSKLEYSKEAYLLRKDDKGHWKIFGWKVLTEEAI